MSGFAERAYRELQATGETVRARTADYPLRKVFVKPGISSRAGLRTALADVG